MRKFSFLIVVVSIVFSSCLYVFSKPGTASAVDPSYPDQGCVDVNNSGLYTWGDHSPTVVFVPRFNWLNAVSVRIKGTNPTGTPKVQAQIWNWTSIPHRLMAMTTVELENRVEEYWQHFNISSQDMDPGLSYALALVPKEGTQFYWSATTNTSCYTRGYAMNDGVNDASKMYGFVTYGWYDINNPSSGGSQPDPGTPSGGSTSGTSGSTGAPSSDPLVTDSSSSTGSTGSTGSSSSGTGSTGSKSSKSTMGTSGSKSAWTPDIAGILADYGKDENSGGFLGFLANVFSSPIMFYLWPLLSFLFWVGVIVLIIVLVRRRRKKKEATVAATQTKPETEKKEEPKKEEKK